MGIFVENLVGTTENKGRTRGCWIGLEPAPSYFNFQNPLGYASFSGLFVSFLFLLEPPTLMSHQEHNVSLHPLFSQLEASLCRQDLPMCFRFFIVFMQSEALGRADLCCVVSRTADLSQTQL